MSTHIGPSQEPGKGDASTDLWIPKEFVSKVLGTPMDRFLSEYGGTYFLLVQIEETASELVAGLRAAAGFDYASTPDDGLGFATVQRSPDSVMALLANRRRQEQSSQMVGDQMIPQAFREQPCFVFPLKKRSEESFLDRITVGRSRNHDVVLRHRSVSKFHGWFECTREGRIMVGDAGSKNRTHLGGRAISNSVEAVPGDILRFGSVEATLCTPEVIWRAIAG